LVPWLAALDRVTTMRGALASGLFMCLAFTAAVFGWFAGAIRNYTGAPWSMAVLVLLLLAPLLQPQMIAFALTRYLARRGGAGWWRTGLTGALVYVGTEWASPKLFSDTIGHGLYASALLRQAADLAGAAGLTFVLLLGNECTLALVRAVATTAPFAQRRRRALAPAGALAALVLALVAYGAVRLSQFPDDERSAASITAGVVQADISRYDRLAAEIGTYDAVRMILDNYFALSAQALRRNHPDLLVWPETVYPTTFGSPKSEDGAAFDREIGAFVAHAGVPLVFGAYDVDGGHEFNAAVFLEPTTDRRLAFETYRKQLLFPLTERVPTLLDSALVRRWLPWLGTWKPGRGRQVLSLPLRNGHTLRVAPLICYDAVDPSLTIAAVRQGAEVIITLSNDSWFASGAGPHLHLVVSAFRSIETRRPQLRATNTGISAIITPTGQLLGTIGVHGRTALVAVVTPVRGVTTLMLAWGDWFGPTALACGAALLALSLLSKAPPIAAP